ncbi:MAG: response regulator [Thermodesulfobacteriota bacterium]
MENKDAQIPVLVVDDEEDIREACTRILTRMGCKVSAAPTGNDALSLMEEEPFSIVLLDLKMPGLDGMEVLRIIQERNKNVLIIVITGYATVETAIEAMKQGAYDFIPKPFEPAQLRIVVGRALEKQRLQAEAELSESLRQRTLLDLGKEKSRIRTIIEALPNGVVVLNAQGKAVLLNPAFRLLAGLPPETGPGGPISAYLQDEGVLSLATRIYSGEFPAGTDIPPYEFALPGERFLMVRGRPVLGPEGSCLGAVLVLTDVTSLKVLDRLKDEFVAKVSHELRSPLATIHEQLAMVMADTVSQVPEKDQNVLSRVKEKTQGLISLIGDLLDLSRIESGAIAQKPSEVKLDELLSAIVDFMGAQAKAKGQSLSLAIQGEGARFRIMADPMVLESIFGNLVTNAINYTQQGGEITVSLSLDGGEIKVAVADNGFGMERKHLDRIFEKFYRVKTEQTRHITGTGLGLSIVKGLVESLKGRISVGSAPGKGSVFTVWLPLSQEKNAAGKKLSQK